MAHNNLEYDTTRESQSISNDINALLVTNNDESTKGNLLLQL